MMKKAVIITLTLVLASTCNSLERGENSTQNIQQNSPGSISSEESEPREVDEGKEEEKLKCGEKEFQETRSNYEKCASEKIGSVTAWLQKVASGEQGEQEVVISQVCSHVQDLLHSCGDELGWCFTAHQVDETKKVQKAGIRDILSRHLPEEKVESCLQDSTPQTKGPGPQKTMRLRPEPRSLLLAEDTANKTNQDPNNNQVEHVYDLFLDNSNEFTNDPSESTADNNSETIADAHNATEDNLTARQNQQPASSTAAVTQEETTAKKSSTSLPVTTSLPRRQQNLPPPTPPSSNKYPTECDQPACGGICRSSANFYTMMLFLVLTVFSKRLMI